MSLGGTLVAEKEVRVQNTRLPFSSDYFIERFFDNHKILPRRNRDIDLQDKETISFAISFQLHLSAEPTKLAISKLISLDDMMISLLMLLFFVLLINSNISTIYKAISLFLTG